MRLLRVLAPGLVLGVLTVAAPALAVTASGVPDAPAGVQWSVSQDDVLTVTWQPPAADAPAPNEYTLTEEPSGAAAYAQPPATSVSMRLGAATYTLNSSFTLVATNAAGSSPAVVVPVKLSGGTPILIASPVRITANGHGAGPDVLRLHDPVADGTKVTLTINGTSYQRAVHGGIARVVLKDPNGTKRTRYTVVFDGTTTVLRVR